MKLQRSLWAQLSFILLILNFTPGTISISILQLVGIKTYKDVISLVNDATMTFSECWYTLENTSEESDNNLSHILKRFSEINNDINIIEKKYTFNNNLIILQLLSKYIDTANTTMHPITQRFKDLQQFVVHKNNLDATTLLTFAEFTVSTDGFAVKHLMDSWHMKIFDTNDDHRGNNNKLYSNLFELLVSSYKQEQKCLNQQSTQQFIYSLYTNIAITELKAYTLLELSWLILSVYDKGNFAQDAEIIRKNYEKRLEESVRQLYKLMQRADRMIWRCDPERHVEHETYEQVTRLLQAYIENEVDMSSSRDCMQSCSAYGRTSNVGCYMDQFCAKQERCSGQIHDCYYVSGYITACPSAFECLRRYEYVKYNDRTVGRKQGLCQRGESQANSWMRYVLWECSYCICLCDDQNSIKTDRYFNLRETLSNTDDNKVVTGLRLTKVNRVFHLQIQEGQLLPRGMINESSLTWKPLDNYTIYERGVIQNQDYFSLTYDARSIDLDNIETYDENYVVTGVRFQVLGAHLNLQARFSKFNYASGQLVNPKEISYWKINDINQFRRNEIVLEDRDIPIHSSAKSEPNFGANQYLKISVSSLEKDVSQTNIPFIDIQEVVSKPPVPLAGIGLYYKGTPGYGGFLAPKIITYDFAPRIPVTRR